MIPCAVLSSLPPHPFPHASFPPHFPYSTGGWGVGADEEPGADLGKLS